MTEIKKQQKINELNQKEECQCWPNWVKYSLIILIIAIFIMCCFMIHYLWKLSDIWQAVKNLPNK